MGRALVGTVGRGLAPFQHRLGAPSLREMYDAGCPMATDLREAVVCAVPGVEETDLAAWDAECDGVLADLNRVQGELGSHDRTDPDRYGLGERSARLLYCLIRSRRPEVVLETGVARGHSTFIILRALERNGSGALHSLDVRRDVGDLAATLGSHRWSLHRPDGPPPKFFADFVARLGAGGSGIDLFLHDSDHSYTNQMWEYRNVWPHLSGNGVLASDDIDKSNAFLDFVAEHGLSPVMLLDQWKVLGLTGPGIGGREA